VNSEEETKRSEEAGMFHGLRHQCSNLCGKRWIVVLLGGRYGQLPKINCLLTDD
jgi:hypothetical protein